MISNLVMEFVLGYLLVGVVLPLMWGTAAVLWSKISDQSGARPRT